MADFRIKVIFDTEAAKQKASEFTGSLGNIVKQMKVIGTAFAAAFIVKKITEGLQSLVNLGEELDNINDKLALVTTSSENLADVQKQLFEVANRTRASYETTADVFVQTSRATKELGLSQQEVLRFTESLSKAVVLSGTSLEEARGAIEGLSRGMALGELKARGVIGVLQDLPVVADVLAEHLKVPTDQLDELARQGKITAKTFVDAFSEAQNRLDTGFSNSVETAAEAMTQLKNQEKEAFGPAAAAINATWAKVIVTFTPVIIALINDIVKAMKFLVNVIAALGGTFRILFTIWEELPTRISAGIIPAINKIIVFTESSINSLIDIFNKVREKFNQPLIDHIEINKVDAVKLATSFGEDIAKAFQEGFDETKQFFNTGGGGAGGASGLGLNPGGASFATEAVLERPLKFDTNVPKSGILGDDLITINDHLDNFNGKIEETVSLVPHLQEAFNPLFDVLLNGFQAAEDAFVDFVTTGKINFKGLVDSVLADVSRLLFRQGIFSILNAAGVGGNFVQSLRGFQTGGSFSVGGSGGPDSQLVAFKASPGEKVNVGSGGNQTVVPAPEVRVNISNHLDPGIVLDALTTQPGERAIINVIQRNPSVIRKVLGG